MLEHKPPKVGPRQVSTPTVSANRARCPIDKVRISSSRQGRAPPRGPLDDIAPQPQETSTGAHVDRGDREVAVTPAVHADALMLSQPKDLGHSSGVEEVVEIGHSHHGATLVDILSQFF